MSQQFYYDPFGNNSDVNEAKEEYILRAQSMKQEKKEIRAISFSMGCAIIAYLLIQVFFGDFLEAFNLTELYTQSPIFKYACSILAVSICAVALPFGIMALVNKKRYTASLIPNNSVGALNTTAWVFFGVFSCVISNLAVSYISLLSQNLFGYELTQGDVQNSLPDSAFACVLELISLAVVPAICEEFAMRCCSLQLLKKYGKGFSVLAVSIVFGLLHGNIVQFLFAFFVGLILGFITIKTENITPAILIHFINNGMSVVQDIVKANISEDAGSSAVLTMYAVFSVLGIISLVYLAVKKQFKSNKSENNSLLTNAQKFRTFLFPWMIVPFVALILLTATTIKKV